MTDSFRLYRPDLATYVDVGTWIDASKQISFGDESLHKTTFTDSPFIEGGMLVSKISGERTMQFPLLVPSSFAGGLTALEGVIRQFAAAGGALDIALDGGGLKYVRFNILAGRLL